MFISNWNENRNDKEYVKKAKSYIKKEVIRNRADLKNVTIKHNNTVDSLYKFTNRNDYTVRDFIEHVEGFQISELKKYRTSIFCSE